MFVGRRRLRHELEVWVLQKFEQATPIETLEKLVAFGSSQIDWELGRQISSLESAAKTSCWILFLQMAEEKIHFQQRVFRFGFLLVLPAESGALALRVSRKVHGMVWILGLV